MKKLKSKKGFIKYPCDKYPDSYALKHWQLGKSWLIDEYYVIDKETNEVIKYSG